MHIKILTLTHEGAGHGHREEKAGQEVTATPLTGIESAQPLNHHQRKEPNMKSRNTILSMSVFTLAVVASSGAIAQATMSGGKMGDMKMGDMKMQQSAEVAAMTDGEVRKVDKNARKITIKHGPIKNLDMPGMTMVFQAKDPAMLEKVQKGDKVKFKAAMDGSAMVITEIQPAQ